MKRSTGMIVLMLFAAAAGWGASAPAAQLELTVRVTEAGGKAVPVHAAIDLPAALAALPAEKIGVAMKCAASGASVPGQIVLGGRQAQLWWVLPEAKVGTSKWTATLSARPYGGKDVFAFEDTKGKHLDLRFGGRLVTRLMYEFDRSSKEKIFETYKPYHHVFDAAGKDVITKGAPGHDPHHRGIYIGWGKTTCGGKSYNFWSMGGGSAQVLRKFSSLTAGPVLARSAALIEWIDKDDKVIISEQRETTCFRQPSEAIMLMEFRTELTAVGGELTLSANAEHGGFQYRAHNQVAINVGAARGKQTADKASSELKTRYAFHKEGIKTPGQKLNGNTDLPWAAQSTALRGKRYSVQHMNHKSNPKGTIYSAYRQYGRFGAYFKKTMKAGEVLPLVYRIHAAERTMPPREEMNLRHAAFNEPPVVTVAK